MRKRNVFETDTSHSRDGVGLNASLMNPHQLVADSKGVIYLVDFNAVRKINPQHKVTTIATVSGSFLCNCDQSKRKEKGTYVLPGIAVDEEGGLVYFSDSDNSVIWKMTTEGENLEIMAGQKSKVSFLIHLK